MARYERINESTPNGGDYSEIYYFDDNGDEVDASMATKCVIRECMNDGTMINEIWSSCNNE